MKINLVILAAGQGTRFSENGIIIPKPLINLNGKPFFYWSTSSIEKFVELESLIFVVLKEHVEKWNIHQQIYRYYPRATVVELKHLTKGPAETAFKSLKWIQNDLPIVFNDCDHFFMSESFNTTVTKTKFSDWTPNGALLTFKSNDSRYSYITYENNQPVGTIEKSVPKNSTDAICGAYMFINKSFYKKIYEVYKKQCNYKELFLSGMYNIEPLKNSFKIFNTEAHIPFGTPEEYQIANKFFSYFN